MTRSKKSPAQSGQKFSIIGKPRRRVDALSKVTGQTLFADDIVLPRMLYCKLFAPRCRTQESTAWM
jgi:hypothetical protein